MYRLAVGVVHVLAPVQAGVAVTLTVPHWDRGSGVGLATGIAVVLALAAWWGFRGLTRAAAARRAWVWLGCLSAALPAGVGGYRLTAGGTVAGEWRAFRAAYLTAPLGPPARVGPWAIEPMPTAPVRPAGRESRALLAAAGRTLAVDYLRVQTSTPGWAWVGTLVVATCYRPRPGSLGGTP